MKKTLFSLLFLAMSISLQGKDYSSEQEVRFEQNPNPDQGRPRRVRRNAVGEVPEAVVVAFNAAQLESDERESHPIFNVEVGR